jgi:DNA-directed RNA polymerase I, II, and III subunit RPABC2
MADYEEDAAYEEAPQEEVVPETDVAEEEQTEQQRAEAADILKLLKQHPEIWIPYEEQIQERLNTKQGPGPTEDEVGLLPKCGLRDTSLLDAAHTTYPFLTNYERTKCISYRASQICNGAKPYILVPEGVTDAYEIAKLELEAKRLPFIVKRPLPDGTFEVWRLTDLLLL